MELQTFITNTEHYIQELKKLNLYVKTHSKKKLALVKYHYDKKYDTDTYPWIKYCRGVIIDTETNKIVCVPPVKAVQETNIDSIDTTFEDNEYQLLVDGTMINVFNHKNEWIFSTRSSIGATNSWDGKQSFYDMFQESVETNEWMDDLNKDHCYSFVLVHKNNRIVSPVMKNQVYLVEQYHVDELKRVPLDSIQGIENVYTFDKGSIPYYKDPNLPYSVKGFNVKCGSHRIKWINPHYEHVNNLKINYNDKLLHYIQLRQNGTLREYLNYFPEESYIFSQHRDTFNEIKLSLLKTYCDHFIHKTLEKQDIPYEFKPLIYAIHGEYLNTGVNRNEKNINIFLHNLPAKRYAFVYNYFKETHPSHS
jgi:hypothetical protein